MDMFVLGTVDGEGEATEAAAVTFHCRLRGFKVREARGNNGVKRRGG